MKHTVIALGALFVLTGAAAFADDAKPEAAAPAAPAAAKTPAKPSALTPEMVLESIRQMPAEKRATVKERMTAGREHLVELKKKAEADGDEALSKQLGTALESMDYSLAMLAGIEESEAAKAAGDTEKQAAADKAVEAKATDYCKLMEQLMARSREEAAKRKPAPPEAGATVAKEPLVYGKAGEIAVRASYISVTADGTVYAACGKSVKQFGPDRKLVREWEAPAQVVAADGKGALYAVGGRKGSKLGVGKDGKPEVERSFEIPENVKAPTSMKVSGDVLLIGESYPGRCIYKVGKADGKLLGKVRCNVSTCCGILDFTLDAKGNAVIANLGQHRVSVAPLDGDGKSVVNWGAAGDDPGKFCGCCNPVSVALLPDGSVATSEKTITRIKIYSADGGTLLMNMPAGEIGSKCEKLDIAADAAGNIYVNDTTGGKVLILSPAKKAAPAGK